MTRILTIAALAAVTVATNWLGAQTPNRSGDAEPSVEPDKSLKAKPLGGDWEARFSDDSTMKLSLLDERISLQTPYGLLAIPARDIRKIEFGVRLTSEEQAGFDAALAAVATGDAKKREEGKAALKAFGAKIAPFLKTAIKRSDPESRPQLEMVYEAVAGDRIIRKAEPRDSDTITTDESQFAGRIVQSQFRIGTFQFGELALKIADCKALQFGGLTQAPDEKVEIVDAANFYPLFQTHLGKTVGIKLTGAIGGSVYGSGPYTGDSNLAAAAVHSGALKVGETKIVRVRIVPTPNLFASTTANGVTTIAYGQYSTAYEIVVK